MSSLPVFFFFFGEDFLGSPNTIDKHFQNLHMKFFIDTANLDQIKEANDLGILDGVTTNPSLMAKEGIKGEEAITQHYKTICELVDGDISAEVLGVGLSGVYH